MAHSFYIGPPCFPVFNDQELSMEPITTANLVPFIRSDNEDMNFAADAAWSSDCTWYFVILQEGIALFNVYDRRGLLCERKSAMFIGACMNAGILANPPPRKRRTKLKAASGEG